VILGLIGRGRMGSEVERLAHSEGHEVAFALDESSNAGGRGLTQESLAGIDAVIDFSLADVVLEDIRRVAEAHVPMVVGTTGWYDHLEAARRCVEENDSALVYGANFSIGAHLFLELAKVAAKLFDGFPNYDPFVFEHHHRDKADAPSGTALRLARLVLDRVERKTEIQIGNPESKIAKEALHVSSLRAGGAFGHHVLGFDGTGDRVEIAHVARSREGFARGALYAAEWIRGKKGVYDFANVLNGVSHD
jgi:4-hydroxy-tetrahydrodipicolinate reductase